MIMKTTCFKKSNNFLYIYFLIPFQQYQYQDRFINKIITSQKIKIHYIVFLLPSFRILKVPNIQQDLFPEI